jgi:prophage regulatory protein
MTPFSKSRILRSHELAAKLGVSRVTLWRWERQGLLPGKTQIGPNIVGWLESEIDEWWNRKLEPAAPSKVG